MRRGTPALAASLTRLLRERRDSRLCASSLRASQAASATGADGGAKRSPSRQQNRRTSASEHPPLLHQSQSTPNLASTRRSPLPPQKYQPKAPPAEQQAQLGARQQHAEVAEVGALLARPPSPLASRGASKLSGARLGSSGGRSLSATVPPVTGVMAAATPALMGSGLTTSTTRSVLTLAAAATEDRALPTLRPSSQAGALPPSGSSMASSGSRAFSEVGMRPRQLLKATDQPIRARADMLQPLAGGAQGQASGLEASNNRVASAAPGLRPRSVAGAAEVGGPKVHIDPTTVIPVGLYEALLLAGKKAKERGQHRLRVSPRGFPRGDRWGRGGCRASSVERPRHHLVRNND
eukprot:TRINITY_DN94011_c0_g1_i1.p1 TRINITY_DN94011_c0_g1~~TRINITY_DN94011_c0_g1_i1.p1  ORF type:complete len:351 (+),score=33.07 TRINITY_DN94011_c0_g1_i1:84-1136(+)